MIFSFAFRKFRSQFTLSMLIFTAEGLQDRIVAVETQLASKVCDENKLECVIYQIDLSAA